MILEWSDEYSLSNNIIDAQHKKLFKLVNTLSQLNERQVTFTNFKKTLNYLVQYALQHFKDEEILQRLYDYPQYAEHKKVHDDFTATAGILSKITEKEFSPEKFISLKGTLYNWLKQHVAVDDKKIGDYIRGKVPDIGKLTS